eukprot:895775-Pleurochrysis_carterae.AAC.1
MADMCHALYMGHALTHSVLQMWRVLSGGKFRLTPHHMRKAGRAGSRGWWWLSLLGCISVYGGALALGLAVAVHARRVAACTVNSADIKPAMDAAAPLCMDTL